MFDVLSERGLTAEYEVAYQIGSGTKGRTYAVQVGRYLLESPLSWYASSAWDVSPGFESSHCLISTGPSRQTACSVTRAELSSMMRTASV